MKELPHVMRPTTDGQPGILKEMVLWNQDTWWLKNRYFRRGRIVEHMATRAALGNPLPDNDRWWSQGSGDTDDPDDYIAHEECRPAVNGALRWLKDSGFRLYKAGLEVINPTERYEGTLDWIGDFPDFPRDYWIVDLKHGQPPPERIEDRPNPLWVAYRLQTALYKLALATQYHIFAKRAGLHLFDDTYRFVKHDCARDQSQALVAVRGYHLRRSFV